MDIKHLHINNKSALDSKSLYWSPSKFWSEAILQISIRDLKCEFKLLQRDVSG